MPGCGGGWSHEAGWKEKGPKNKRLLPGPQVEERQLAASKAFVALPWRRSDRRERPTIGAGAKSEKGDTVREVSLRCAMI